MLALVAFLGAWIAWMMGGRTIVKPTREILDATRLLQKGQLDVRIPMHSVHDAGEFTKIADGFNAMAESLQQREQDLEAELARSQQSRATLDLTVNSMQEGLIAVDAFGRPLLVNEAASRLFVLAQAPTVLSAEWPQHLGLYLPGADTLYAFDQLPLYKALQGQSGGPQHILVRNAAVPAGRLISCSYRPMHGRDGLVGALMVFADITQLEQLQLERAKSYAELRETQRKLLEAQRMGRIGNWESDFRTGQLWWSEEVYALYGLAPGTVELCSDMAMSMMHPEDRGRYVQGYERSVGDRSEYGVEFRVITPAGDVRWMHQLCKPHFDETGQVIYRTGVIQDITARKQSELALVHTTDLLRRTGEMAMVGGWELVLDGMRLTSSEQVLRIHELEPGAPWGLKTPSTPIHRRHGKLSSQPSMRQPGTAPLGTWSCP
ncbi:PAS domain S-box protein [Polaromonas sp. P1(28)-8]|nr:PAS domain S-box protein [Polaromonas sp. P1(28)-8]